MKRFSALILLSAVASSISGAEESTGDENSAAYDQAGVLGRCAGMLEFAGAIAEKAGQPYIALDARQKASDWRIATRGALLAAGWRGGLVDTKADSIYESSLTGWMTRLESGAQNAPEELSNAMDFCLQHDAVHKKYRETYYEMIDQ